MFSRIFVRETAEGMASKAARAIQMKIMENNQKKYLPFWVWQQEVLLNLYIKN